MKHITILLLSLLLIGCAESGSQSNPSPSEPSQIDTVVDEPVAVVKCKTSYQCEQACMVTFPHQTTEQVKAECNRRGLLYGPYCEARIAENQREMVKYLSCLENPI